jgi:hypothetical protein
VSIPEGQNEVLYPINADSGAQIGHWKVFASGAADVRGTAWVSSQLAHLEVAEPHVTLTAQRASCEQGQPAKVLCEIHHHRAFEGAARLELLGLPPNVAASPVELTHETPHVVLDVTTQPSSPVGQHRGILLQLTLIENGEPIVSRAGAVDLQIDQPLPAVANQPAAAPPPAPPTPETSKPLSRLARLRLEAQARSSPPPAPNPN